MPFAGLPTPRRLNLLLPFSVLAISTMLLGGCKSPAGACPPLVTYTPDFKARLSVELHSLGEASASAQAVEDYVSLREQIAACLKA